MNQDSSLHAPEIIDLEVLSVLRRLLRTGDIDQRRAMLAIRDLEDLALTRYPHLPLAQRAWELRGNLTPYDAAYVALAESLECVLVTTDARLARSPTVQCEVEVLR